MGLGKQLQALGVDLVHAVETLDHPVTLTDAQGFCVWQNAAAIELIGDVTGTKARAIPPDYLASVHARLARMAMGAERVAHRGSVVLDTRGERRHVELTTVSLLRDGSLAGVLAFVSKVSDAPPRLERRLSPREHETLLLLANGLNTAQIADSLGIARETARNHIRGVIRVLGVHSRVAAVARGHELGLL